MAHKVILPPKKNYIPQFLKQRDINSYKGRSEYGKSLDGGRTRNPDGTFGQEDYGNDRMEGIRK